ncbi:MAG: hypothetical protein WCV71_04805 [Patescibacteria group bacterium]|jgi:hypothetical protein
MNSEIPNLTPEVDNTIEDIEKNRLNVLKNEDDLPPSIAFGREVRKKLKENIEENGNTWPEAPKDLTSTNDFFEATSKTVSKNWTEKASGLITEKCQLWLEQIPAETQAENPEIIAMLSEPDKLELALSQQRLSILSPLREILPEAWETLSILSSERQLAKIALSRQWIKTMPEESFSQMGISREEFLLQNDLASLAGKLIDHGYIKQDQLDKSITADSNDEASEAEAGRKYVYSLPTKDSESTPASFNEVLPFELGRFKNDLTALATKVEKLIDEKKLPETYQELPNYLRLLAETYNSSEKDPAKLYLQWQKLYETNSKLLASGCPLVINPQEDDPFTVVGLEMRLGFRSQELQSLEQQSTPYIEKAYQLNEQAKSENPAVIASSPQKNAIFLNNQSFAFGPNLQSQTMAESYHGQMFIHANAVENTARQSELPLLKKILKRDINDREYIQSAILETTRHETAHSILASEDEAVIQRIGESSETDIVEELKAETLGMALAEDERKLASEKEMEMMFLAKLGTMLNFLKNKPSEEGAEGEDYYLCGVKIITELVNNGSIKIENGQLNLINARAGMARISEIGYEILDMYKNMDTTPEDIKSYAAKLRDLKNDPSFTEFMELIK